MRRIFVIACVFGGVIASSDVHAQDQGANVGINFSVAGPLGDNSDYYKPGFGGDISFDYYFNKTFDLGVEVGYKAFGYDDYTVRENGIEYEVTQDGHLNMVPILLTAGFHGDVNEDIDFYGELGGGAFIFSDSETDDSETYGGLSPRLGLAFELSEDLLFLDVNANYTHVFTDGDSDFNTLGLNIGLLYTVF